MNLSEVLKMNTSPTQGTAESFVQRMAGDATTKEQLTARQLVEKGKPIPATRTRQLLDAIAKGPNKTDIGLSKMEGRQAGGEKSIHRTRGTVTPGGTYGSMFKKKRR